MFSKICLSRIFFSFPFRPTLEECKLFVYLLDHVFPRKNTSRLKKERSHKLIMSSSEEIKNTWTLKNSELIKHCEMLQAPSILRSLARKETVTWILSQEKQDKVTFTTKKSSRSISDGLFTAKDVKMGTIVGMITASKMKSAALFQLPQERPLTEKALEQAVQEYEKEFVLCQAEDVLTREEEGGNYKYSFFTRLKADLKKDTEVWKSISTVQSIVATYLQSVACPNKHFSEEDLQLLDRFCGKLVGKSQKQAFLVYSIYSRELHLKKV